MDISTLRSLHYFESFILIIFEVTEKRRLIDNGVVVIDYEYDGVTIEDDEECEDGNFIITIEGIVPIPF